MATYKNTSSEDLAIPGVGIVKAGETAELPGGFHNANFEPVGEKVKRPRRETVDALQDSADEA